MNGLEAAPAVVGVGNVLLGDDGVGPRVVDELRRLRARDARALPPTTRLVDAGTLDLDALAALDGATSLVVVDAVDRGLAPGTVITLRHDDFVRDEAGPADAVTRLLAVGRLAGWVPDEVAIVGVQAVRIDPAVELSAPVTAAIPAAVAAVRRVLDGSLGAPSTNDTRARMAGGRTCA